MSVLQVEGLKKVYGSRSGSQTVALAGMDLDVSTGDFVGIMGPSGSGKTTLLNIIATIDRPTAGRVLLGGVNISQLKDAQLAAFRRDELGFMFQEFNLLDTMTIKENIILPLVLGRVDVSEIERRLEWLANRLGISAVLDKYPYEASGGQKQRAAAARAVINNPQIVLADEPTGALDSKSSRELLRCLEELNEQDGATILMVTHDAFAASYCRRIVFIKDGLPFAELVKGDDRRLFFKRILDVMAAQGGSQNDLF